MKRILLFWVAVICLAQLLLPAPGSAEEILRVLIIRPQRLPLAAAQAVANGSQRDPFGWPAGFMARVRPLDPEAGREALPI